MPNEPALINFINKYLFFHNFFSWRSGIFLRWARNFGCLGPKTFNAEA